MYNIPTDIPAKSMWLELKDCGKIIDIILSRKRDNRNKRIGFIKTHSEEEAGWIISNAKERGGIFVRVKMNINELEKRPSGNFMDRSRGDQKKKEYVENKRSVFVESEKNTKNSAQVHSIPKGNFRKPKDNLEESLGVGMFEYIEAVVDDEVEK